MNVKRLAALVAATGVLALGGIIAGQAPHLAAVQAAARSSVKRAGLQRSES